MPKHAGSLTSLSGSKRLTSIRSSCRHQTDPSPRRLASRRTWLCWAMLSAAGCALSCQRQARFHRFVFEEAGCSLEFPENPTTSTVIAQSDYGPLDLTLITARFEKENYALIFVDYPREALPGAKEVFDAALIDVASDLGGQVERHFQTSLGKVPGRGYEIEFGRERVACGRLYLVRSRLYHVQIALPRQERDSAHIARFFDSFRLLGPGQAS